MLLNLLSCFIVYLYVFIFVLALTLGYHGCRNEDPLCWEFRAVEGSFFCICSKPEYVLIDLLPKNEKSPLSIENVLLQVYIEYVLLQVCISHIVNILRIFYVVFHNHMGSLFCCLFGMSLLLMMLTALPDQHKELQKHKAQMPELCRTVGFYFRNAVEFFVYWMHEI